MFKLAKITYSMYSEPCLIRHAQGGKFLFRNRQGVGLHGAKNMVKGELKLTSDNTVKTVTHVSNYTGFVVFAVT